MLVSSRQVISCFRVSLAGTAVDLPPVRTMWFPNSPNARHSGGCSCRFYGGWKSGKVGFQSISRLWVCARGGLPVCCGCITFPPEIWLDTCCGSSMCLCSRAVSIKYRRLWRTSSYICCRTFGDITLSSHTIGSLVAPRLILEWDVLLSRWTCYGQVDSLALSVVGRCSVIGTTLT